MNKLLAIILSFFTLSVAVYSQSLNIFQIDKVGFPTVKAKMYAFDASGQQARPNVGALNLTENGTQRAIVNVQCPVPEAPQPVSVAISIDISGSMASNDFGENPIDLAKLSASELCNSISHPNSEISVQICDDIPDILTDFTNNKQRALNVISTVKAEGKNDFRQQLLHQIAGVLNIAKRGGQRRTAVMFTDALWDALKPNELKACFDTCQKYSIRFYVVDFSKPLDDQYGIKTSLRALCSNTGGFYFENVITQMAARDNGKIVQQLAQGVEPCEITWQSQIACTDPKIEVELKWNNVLSRHTYFVAENFVASLETNPSLIAFGKRKPGMTYDETLTISAKNSDFTIKSIKLKGGSLVFSVQNVTYPFVIPKNTDKKITIRFSLTDSILHYSLFEIESDLCPAYYSCTGGFFTKPSTNSLKLTYPNGGENLIAGNTAFVTWEGIAPKDTITIELSKDNGKSWEILTENASGFSYEWKNIPKPPSNECRIRVKQYERKDIDTSTATNTLEGHTEKVNHVAWSSTANRLATASWDRTAKVWDAATGSLIHTLSGHQEWVNYVAWSPDGAMIATAAGDKTIKIWDAAKGALLRTLTGHDSWVTYVSWSPDGTRLASASGDKTAKVWDASSGLLLFTLSGHVGDVYNVSWSPDGSKLATSSWDYTAKVWESASGKLIHTLRGHGTWVSHVAWSPDGSKLATSSWDKTSIVWNSSDGSKLNTLRGHKNEIYTIAWSPNGKRLATACYDNTAKIWDAQSGLVIHDLKGHYSEVNHVTWSRDGKYVATAGYDNTAKVWNADKGTLIHSFVGHKNSVKNLMWDNDSRRLATASNDFTAKIWYVENINEGDGLIQKDSSDGLFSIIIPSGTGKNIDLKKCIVGTTKDTLIRDVVRNTGTIPLRVDSIFFLGSDALSFTIVSGKPPFTIDAGQGKSMEFGFAPSRVGLHSAQMIIIMQSDTLVQNIIGEGISPTLQIITNLIDFGKVALGEWKDSSVVTVKNIGTIPLTINDIRLGGPNTNDFIVLNDTTEFVLQPNEQKNLTIRFKPSALGLTSGHVFFDYNGIGSPAGIQLFGTGIKSGLIAPDLVDFGQVIVGKKGFRSITLSNYGTEDISIQSVRFTKPNDTIFGIEDTIQPFTLHAAESRVIQLSFQPPFKGIFTSEIRIVHDDEGSPLIIRLLGEGIEENIKPDTVRTSIVLNKIKAKAGENIRIYLYINGKENLDLANSPKEFEAKIKLNNTIIYVNDANYMCTPIDGQSCELFVRNARGLSDTLATISGIATLGNTDNALMELISFKWLDTVLTTVVTKEDGSIQINGVCEEGGIRLYLASGNVYSLASRPNPVRTYVDIVYGMAESNTVTVEIINVEGKVIATPISSVHREAGAYIHKYDTSTLGNGIYLLRLRTSNSVITSRMEVIH